MIPEKYSKIPLEFRVWDKFNNRYYYWDNLSDHKIPSNYTSCCDLEQFTGLYDKNAKKIYAGDIVKMYGVLEAIGGEFLGYDENGDVWMKDYIKDWVGVVVWQKYGARYMILFEDKEQTTDFSGGTSNIEVIGNLHENAGLLPKGENNG